MFLVHTIIPSLARSCANPIISNFEFKSGVRFFSKSKNIIDFGKINIVGDGIGALKFLEHLSSKFYSLKDCHASGEIILYSPSNKIGPGFSYSNENSENYLINNGMDHLGGDSRYLSWLENTNKLNSYQKSISIKTMPYPPRPHFGLYMESMSKDYISKLEKSGFLFTLKNKSATKEDIKSDLDNQYSKIICCVGGMKSRTSIYDKEASHLGKSYISDHVTQAKEIKKIALNSENIVILGTGLSSLDVIRELLDITTLGSITAVSRKGILPLIRPSYSALDPEYLSIKKLLTKTLVTYEDLYKSIENDFQLMVKNSKVTINSEQKIDFLKDPTLLKGLNEPLSSLKEQLSKIDDINSPYSILHHYFNELDTILNTIFSKDKMPAEDMNKVRRNIEPGLAIFVSAMPKSTAMLIASAIEKNRLNIIGGVSYAEKSSLNSKHSNNVVTLFDKNKKPLIHSDMLINVTGADNLIFYENSNSFTGQLVQDGILSPFTRDGINLGGIDVDEKTSLARTIHSENIYVIGQDQKGKFLNMNSIAQVSKSSEAAAEHIINRQLFKNN